MKFQCLLLTPIITSHCSHLQVGVTYALRLPLFYTILICFLLIAGPSQEFKPESIAFPHWSHSKMGTLTISYVAYFFSNILGLSRHSKIWQTNLRWHYDRFLTGSSRRWLAAGLVGHWGWDLHGTSTLCGISLGLSRSTSFTDQLPLFTDGRASGNSHLTSSIPQLFCDNLQSSTLADCLWQPSLPSTLHEHSL